MAGTSKGPFEEHSFYCLNCGRRGIPLMRRSARCHGSEHRKAMYCPWCKVDINHIELKTDEEVKQFLIDFENGVYREEAETSMKYLKENKGVM